MTVEPRRSRLAFSRPTKATVAACGLAVVGAVVAWRAGGVAAVASPVALPSMTSAPAQSGHWVSIGPNPLFYDRGQTFASGRVASIAIDPRDPSHWLIGAGNGGVWESRDGGGTWSPIADDAPTLAVGAVAFAPSDPNIIYVGTGEYAGGGGFRHVGVGILKSINAGRTWALLAQEAFARSSVKHLRINPGDANIVLAATSRGGFGRDSREGAPVPPAFGVLRSSDGGNTWTRTLAGQITALEVDSTNFNRQYAAVADQRLGVLNDTPGAVSNGIYRSTDGGVRWTRVEGPWGTDPSPTRSTVGRIEFAMAPSNPNVVYAGIQVPPNGGISTTILLGLFKTENAWADAPTWIQIPTEVTGPSGYCGPVECGYAHVLIVDRNDPGVLWAAGGKAGFWRCSNCGAAPVWTEHVLNKGVHPDFHAVAWAGNRLVIGNDGGVRSTADSGATWQNHNRTLTTALFYSAALHPTDGAFMLAGLRDFSLSYYRSGDGWQTTPTAPPPLEWGEAEVALSRSHPDTDWMGAWLNATIVRTTDGGRTRIAADEGIDKTRAAFISPIRKCPTNDDVFLAGTLRVWRSENFFSSTAPTWTANSPPRDLSGNGITEPGAILSIAYGEVEKGCNTYAFGNRGGEVRLTRDGGATWTDLDPSKGLPARPITSLTFDPSNPNRLFAAVSSYDEATPTRPGHTFRTDNALAASPTWTRVGPPDMPFANMPFNVIAIDPRDTRLVYAGSDNGLWQSTDGGNTWTKVGRESGLPPATVHDIQINPTTNRTVIFTYGRGAFELVR
jgi:photosystem II stability/assembly factor-like uncharacterized protein